MTLECYECKQMFTLESELSIHEKIHIREEQFECSKCNELFISSDRLEEHEKIHEENKQECKCDKCGKKYATMNKLRRHDWRAHREIECNICGEMLKCRQDISFHRQNKHQMFRKMICKAFPGCIDEDECFFEHQENISERFSPPKYFCERGDQCNDQSCQFSEAKHKKMNHIDCRFQENCYLVNCSFKHNVERKAFLGEGFLNRNVS